MESDAGMTTLSRQAVVEGVFLGLSCPAEHLERLEQGPLFQGPR